MTEEIVAMLCGLEAVAKGRANLIRSCRHGCADDGHGDQAESARLDELLRLVIEHRKQVRAIRRRWQCPADPDYPLDQLVIDTHAVVSDGHRWATAIAPLRRRVLAEVEASRVATWDSIASAEPRPLSA